MALQCSVQVYKTLITIVTDKRARGIERIWIIGDGFCKGSIQQYYLQNPEKDYFTRTNYEVSAFFSDKYSINGNFLSRIRSALITAINQEWALPKLIVVMLETDVIDYITERQFDSSKQIERFLSYLMNEFRKIMASFKEKLPSKAKRFSWPHFLWLVPVVHTSFRSRKYDITQLFNSSLEATAQLHHNVTALRLKQVWDEHDSSLYLGEAYHRFTSTGLKNWWLAADRTMKFCLKNFDSDLSTANPKKNNKGKSEGSGHYKRSHENSHATADSTSTNFARHDQYHWHRNDRDRSRDRDRDRDHRKNSMFYKLPEPPRRR